MELASPAIDVKNVLFRRRRRTIVGDVNFRMERGEKWVLFGPNGIGKSTIVSMMATKLFPTEGTVDVLGNRLGKKDVFSYRNRIGLCSAQLGRQFQPEEDPLNAVVTALKSTIGRWREEYSEEEYAQARALMARFGVEYLAGKQMWRLSEGERTRILICRALMANPDLLILDEPTTGLDLGGRELVVRTLGELGTEKSNRATLLVTHRLEEIPDGFDHIAIMGRMSQQRSDEIQQGSGESLDISADHEPIINPLPGTIVYTGSLEEGLTDERLSAVFDMPLHVLRDGKRWMAFDNY